MGFTFFQVWQIGIFGLIGDQYGLNITVMLIIGYLLCGGISYLLGSLNFGLIISKYRFRDDVRTHGSGNAGTTNVLRTYGKQAAVFTLLGDTLKSVISVLVVGHMLGGELGACIAGLGCVIGHVYPVFFGFKGGKGVAVTAAMILCLNPPVFAVLFIIFAIIVGFTKYISLGSVVCMMVYPLILFRMSGGGYHVLIAAVIAVFIIFLHRGNIKRLYEGTESKISFKKETEI